MKAVGQGAGLPVGRDASEPVGQEAGVSVGQKASMSVGQGVSVPVGQEASVSVAQEAARNPRGVGASSPQPGARPRGPGFFDASRTLCFDKGGLIPVVLRDEASKEVLTLAYMNEEALQRSLDTGEVWLWSRSRQELWHKGATSGNLQRIVSLTSDCDRDALLIEVIPAGPACHTGAQSCFDEAPVEWSTSGGGGGTSGVGASSPQPGTRPRGPGSFAAGERPAEGEDPSASAIDTQRQPLPVDGNDIALILSTLMHTLAQRSRELPEDSYSSELFRSGLPRITKKIGEEATEVVIAALTESGERLESELADLLFHLSVLLIERGSDWSRVAEVLKSRQKV